MGNTQQDALDAVHTALDTLLSAPRTTGTDALRTLQELERLSRRITALGYPLIREVAEADPDEFGGQRTKPVIADALRIHPADAGNRLAAAAALTPGLTITGQPVTPELPTVAAKVTTGDIGPDHVRVIRSFFHHLPTTIDPDTRDHAETELAHAATQLRPDQLQKLADHLDAYLNPDGTLTDDRDRQRRRHFTLHRQNRDGMSTISGQITPECRAYLETVLAKLARPGMCLPDNPGDGATTTEPAEDQTHRDPRSHSQRCHDALQTGLRDLINSGELGNNRGIPVTVVVTTTLQDLQNAAAEAAAAQAAAAQTPNTARANQTDSPRPGPVPGDTPAPATNPQPDQSSEPSEPTSPACPSGPTDLAGPSEPTELGEPTDPDLDLTDSGLAYNGPAAIDLTDLGTLTGGDSPHGDNENNGDTNLTNDPELTDTDTDNTDLTTTREWDGLSILTWHDTPTPANPATPTTSTGRTSAAPPGKALTLGGTIIPIRDLIRMATHAWHCLAIFDQHTARPLYLGRTKRLANTDQRLVLGAYHGGCTFPACPRPALHCEQHHCDSWCQHGPTDIDTLAPACREHHQLADKGWTVRRTPHGHIEWLPPTWLDPQQTPRINTYHRPGDHYHTQIDNDSIDNDSSEAA